MDKNRLRGGEVPIICVLSGIEPVVVDNDIKKKTILLLLLLIILVIWENYGPFFWLEFRFSVLTLKFTNIIVESSRQSCV